MLETMQVRCTHCGYNNSPEYRFCGMCGASLANPPAPPEPPKKEVAQGGNGRKLTESVHGPSFLGLAEDPKVEFHYLYEDEPSHSHVGLIVFLLIIFGGGGYLGWQWRHNGFPFSRLNAAISPAESPTAPPNSPAEAAPATNQSQDAHADKPVIGAGDVLPTAPEQKSPTEAATKASEPPNSTGDTPAVAASEPKSDGEKAAPPAKTEEAKAVPPPRVHEKSPEKPATQPARAADALPPVVPKTAVDGDLELAGERYLYGNGVPRDCARAESSLRTAATHGNSKAETVLGTMYATGHCVGRDLPTAYRWFARALHQEPQNSRISADLQVLWHQMTPQEQQLATGNR